MNLTAANARLSRKVEEREPEWRSLKGKGAEGHKTEQGEREMEAEAMQLCWFNSSWIRLWKPAYLRSLRGSTDVLREPQTFMHLHKHWQRATALPSKGATTGSIIGAIIGVIILLAIIGTGIALYRKHKNKKMNGDEPPKFKPNPPNKTSGSANRNTNPIYTGTTETSPLNLYPSHEPEPVTDLDANLDSDGFRDEERRDHELYHSAAPSGWDNPDDHDTLPPYMHMDTESYHSNLEANIGRGDSFVSAPMIV